MRIGVAATAPFGADVLERLAAANDIAFLLTRPDKPAGRGRRTSPPPAKIVAERLGIPVLQPERPEIEDADAIVVAAYGLLIPKSLLERALWLNVHPSLLPRWRGAAPVERAIMAGDRETGVTIHRTVKELDAGPVAAQAAFRIEDDDDAGAVFARAAELAADLLEGVLENEPRFEPQPEEGVTYADKISAADRELDLSDPEAAVRVVRALAAHRRACEARRPRRDRVARARRGRSLRPARGAAGREAAHEVRGFRPRAPLISPARKAAFEVVRRSSRTTTYADRALRSASEGLDPRASARSLDSSPTEQCSGCGRSTTQSRHPDTPARPEARSDPCRLRCDSARTSSASRGCAARRGERVRRASSAQRGSSERCRSRTRCSAASAPASTRCSRHCREPTAQASRTPTDLRRRGGATSARTTRSP